ncbi:MAG: hypothetical protein ACRCWO_09030 [Bosea sp. (in: a-proteobacteria)]
MLVRFRPGAPFLNRTTNHFLGFAFGRSTDPADDVVIASDEGDGFFIDDNQVNQSFECRLAHCHIARCQPFAYGSYEAFDGDGIERGQIGCGIARVIDISRNTVPKRPKAVDPRLHVRVAGVDRSQLDTVQKSAEALFGVFELLGQIG